MILILKTGSTYPDIMKRYGDFEDWIRDKMDLEESQYLVHNTGDYNTLPQQIEYSGIIITGSHDMITDLELKNTKLCQWLLDEQQAGIPILGICFGHQLLCVLNSGTVGYNTSGIELGSQDVYLTDAGKNDRLLGSLPPIFKGYKSHQQSILVPPVQAEVLATSYSGVIDAFRVGKNTWGVQFHPEFNQNIIVEYILTKKSELEKKGYKIHQIFTDVEDNSFGELLFDRFKHLLRSESESL
jgi:GMP synthase (glutamine-hydrolysing)